MEVYGERTSSLEAETSDTTGTYTVTQSTEGTFTRSETGNRVDGSYEKTETAEDGYESEQTGVGDHNYTFAITGTNTYTDEEEGNTVTGLYVRTKNGTDEFEMDVSGTKTGGSYTQTTGNYTRTIEGEGIYERISSGAGAEMPTDSGAIDYFWEQAGDPHSGMFDLVQYGVDRYDLLEDFYDISNTQSGRPGHMNVYSFGQPFVDPAPDSRFDRNMAQRWRERGHHDVADAHERAAQMPNLPPLGYIDIQVGFYGCVGMQIGPGPAGPIPGVPNFHPYYGLAEPGASVHWGPFQEVTPGVSWGTGGRFFVSGQAGTAGGRGNGELRNAPHHPAPYFEFGLGTPGFDAGFWIMPQ